MQFIYKNKFIFHITHIKNLPAILKKGILCKNVVKAERIKHEDISYDDIQAVRSIKYITNTKYTLHDCVPLFFGGRPPMLYAIKAKGIAQKDIIYILVDWTVIGRDTTWFTDGNARCSETKFFQGEDNLDKVDFKSINARYWGDKGDDFKRKKQAEVLVYDRILIDDILGFIVYNEDIKSAVQQILDAQNIQKKIFVVPQFYY